MPLSGGTMTGEITMDGGGIFFRDGNVYLKCHGYDNYLTNILNNMNSSFQAGVDALYNQCVSCGATPADKTPTAISTAIQAIFNNRYNAGVAAARPFDINDWSVWAASAGAQLYVDLTNYSTVTFIGISGQTNDDRFSGPGEGNANNSGVVHRIISEGLNGQNKVYDVSGMTGVQQVVIAVATGRVSISRIEFR